MEATNNNLNSINLNNEISFEELYNKLTRGTAYLMRHCAETEDNFLVSLVGEPLAQIQQLMQNQIERN